MSRPIQNLIYHLEVGSGARVFKVLFVLIVGLVTAVLYDALAYRNFSNREAMDMAQLGRNLSESRGYTTLFVRPFSMFLLQKHRSDQSSEIKTAHPDITNPPVYPCILAGLFKLMPARWFVTPAKGFSIYKPDFAVTLLNQFLLLVAGVLLFFLAERLFDSTMAWVTAVVFAGTEVLWHFSVSGLNTIFLIVLLLLVAWCLVVLEKWFRFARTDPWLVSMAGLAGVVVGIGGLTRYAFAWLIVPVLIYLIAFFGQKRAALALAAVGGFLLVMSPWVARNYAVSGMPFGTATFAVCEGTGPFPEDNLPRSLSPGLRAVSVKDMTRKLFQNSRDILQTDVPGLGGSWVTAFFLVGLIVPFRSTAPARLRWFLIASMAVLGVAQGLGRTGLATESPQINSDNLLVLLVPLVFMYGVALFFLLVDSVVLAFRGARLVMVVALCLVASLPLLQGLFPPHPGPVVYPPYYPPLLQRAAGWFSEKELIMSDMPWAMAWYGRRQSVWLTLNWKKDFIDITDYHKPIKAIHLSAVTTDTKFLSNWIKGQNQSWTAFLLESLLQGQVPTGFPLRRAPEGWFPEQLLLTDYERWNIKPK